MAARTSSTCWSKPSPISRRRPADEAVTGPARSLSLAAVAGLALFATAADSSVIVVRSVGPAASTYPVGRTLPDNVRFRLRRGESVTILGRGATRIFRGPGIFSPATPVRPGPRGETRRPHGARLGGIMMSSIDRPRSVAAGDGRRARIGAVRPFGGVPPDLPTIWDIDPFWTGTICLRDFRGPRLVISDEAGPLQLEIEGPGRALRSVRWGANERFRDWPAELPVSDGAAYRLRIDSLARPSDIRFKLLPELPQEAASGDPVALAEVLVAHGCRAQLDRLVDATLVDETD